MVNVTLSIPEELKKRMDSIQEINWSAVARQAFDEKINDLDFIKKFKAKSAFTEEDALKFGKEVSKSLSQRLRKKR